MKIGVVTFYTAKDNYGQVLQYLATQEYLEKRGHDVSLIRHSEFNLSKSIRQIVTDFKLYIYRTFFKKRFYSRINIEEFERNELYKKRRKRIKEIDKAHPRYFDVFRKRYFHIDRLNVFKNQRIFDYNCLVSGSDQIWSGYSCVNFLGFGSEDAMRISIASSCGNHIAQGDDLKRISDLLKRYNLITVREKDGLELCRLAGRNDAYQVLDPSFLLKAKDYSQFEEPLNIPSKPYLMLYILGGEMPVSIDDVYKLAKKKNLDVVYVASHGKEDEYKKIYPTVGQWLSLMRNASYVVTNSFHGTVFSIIYKKTFMSIPLGGINAHMNARLNNLLEPMGLIDRIYSSQLESLYESINYDLADNIIMSNLIKIDNLLSKEGL